MAQATWRLFTFDHMTTITPDREHTRILLANADRTERHDRLAADSVAALRRDGAFALRTPVTHGGVWAGGAAVALRLAGFGRACPSSAWVAGTCATAKTLLAKNSAGPVLDEAFADPDALACGSGVPAARGVRDAGGVRITGRWPNISGCEDADWAGLALTVDETFCWAFIPTGELTVERTWQMAGMRGTGSHTLVADELLLPARWVTPVTMPNPSERIFYAITVLAPIVGAAHGALDLTDAMFASDRKPFMSSYSRMGESPGARHWLAEASHLVDRAQRAMLAVAQASDSDDLTDVEVARMSMDLADAAGDCRAATERLLDLHGASGFAAANPLQRYWRDIAVGSRHPHLSPYLAVERLGSALAG